MSVIWSYPHSYYSYLSYQIQFSSDRYIDVLELYFGLIMFILTSCFKAHLLLYHVHEAIVLSHAYCPRAFVVHAFYLPCLVLYVLTHIVSFPLQAQTITFLIHLVARVSIYGFRWWVLTCSRTMTLFQIIALLFIESCGELWVCHMPPHLEACWMLGQFRLVQLVYFHVSDLAWYWLCEFYLISLLFPFLSWLFLMHAVDRP